MATWKMPAVGEGATRMGYSDRDPYTVVRVSKSGKTAWVKADSYRRTDNNGMSDVGQTYEYTTNDESPEVKVKWTGVRWLGEGTLFRMGERSKFHDFSF